MKKLVIILSAALMTILSGSAWAVKPDRTVDWYIDDVWDLWQVDCGLFDVMVDSDLRETITEFYDKDGNLVKERISIQAWDVVFYNAQHPEISFERKFGTAGFNNQIMVDYVTGEVNTHGSLLRVTIPGEGAVLVMSGHWTWTSEDGWVFRGSNDYMGEGSTDALCEALSP